jgi:hypothetical protein
MATAAPYSDPLKAYSKEQQEILARNFGTSVANLAFRMDNDPSFAPQVSQMAKGLFGTQGTAAGGTTGGAPAQPATRSGVSGGPAQTSSYYGQPAAATAQMGGAQTTATAAGGGGGSSMDWSALANQMGLSQADVTQYQSMGWSPDQFSQAVNAGLSLADISEFHQAGLTPNQVLARYGPPQPETRALGQVAQIDPASEALRQAVSQSYLSPLQQAGAPTAQQFQSYLDLYRQIDPTGAAARAKLGQDLAAQEALGTRLDAATMRELEQQTRRSQIARGNVYGTPQLVQEAMTRGQAGLALQQQRQQALQSYLASGQTPGDVAMNLYNQQQNQLRAAQGAALSYLGSGQTPYQAGASYLNTAEQRAATAAQGGPVYNPQSLGQGYTGSGAAGFPQYGLDIGNQANSWYNSLAAYAGGSGAPQKNRGASAAGGALSGALGGATTGATLGSAVPGIGTAVGAIGGALGGALLGGAGGYFSV